MTDSPAPSNTNDTTEAGDSVPKLPKWTIHTGDALRVLPSIPAGSVDAVITDPPYCSGGVSSAARTGQSARKKYVSSDAQHTLPDFTGDNRDQRSYLAWMSMVLGECLRATRNGGPLLLFSDFRQVPVNSDALQAAGWTWQGMVVWSKPIARPHRGGFRRSCEYILWGTKGPVDAAANPVYLPGLFTASQPRGKERQHITAKPLSLMRELVRVCVPGGTILDPFAGSGSTGVAALTEDRSFVGVEMSDQYTHVARERLDSAR
jgi:site-specific DNA-methyltransferase (adenine-specific)